MLTLACALGIPGIGLAASVRAEEGFAGLYRDPDVSATHVAFVHGDAVWVASRDGGLARRVTREPAAYRFPRFSPDGRTLAYVRGDLGLLPYGDLYTVPVAGGEPARVTHHPDAEILCDWAGPDRLLFFGQGGSPLFRRHELYTVPARGGLPEKLPVGPGAFGALSPDGAWLAYVLHYQDIGLEWKRYRGGAAPDLWLFHLPTRSARRITDRPGTDTLPMWHAGRLHYLSDEVSEKGSAGRRNLWSYDPASGQRRQLTRLRELDARWPAIGPGRQGGGEIVFEQGSGLRLLDLRTGKLSTLDIRVPEAPAAREVDAAAFLGDEGWEISPTGDAAVVEARGDIWILPVAGPPRNLTRSDGAADRTPAWSPDGRRIAWFSDATGEYELTVAPADGSAPARTLTGLGPGFRRDLVWSPDSRSLAFADHTGAIWVQALAGGPARRIDQDPYGFRPRFAWSPDSAWIAYTRTGPNFLSAIWLYDLRAGAAHQVTSGAFDDSSPTFDRKGEHLFFASTRDFGQTTFGLPRPGDLDRPFVHAATQVLLAVPLRGRDGIGLANFEQRAVRLPIAPGGRWTYFHLGTDPRGRLLYSWFDAAGNGSIRLFDRTTGTEETVTAETEDFRVSADGRRLLLRRGREMAIVDAAPGQGMARPLPTAGMTARVDSRREWTQIFTDVWRLARDFFYDPGMHGVDWTGMRRRYAALAARCGSRRDLGYVLNEMLGELDVSHTEVSGGDLAARPRFTASRLRSAYHLASDVGMLGADFELRDGAFRIARIYRGLPEMDLRGPLADVEVREGDVLLAVDGRPLDTGQDPWAAFAGLAGREVEITVSARPVLDVDAGGSRRVKVTPLASEADLRYVEWLRANRELAAERSGGRIGYIHMPFTAIASQSDFYRQLYGQLHLDALILDARWNGGGEGALQVLETLGRAPELYGFVRGGADRPEPRLVHRGPEALLINGLTASGGDGLAQGFRAHGLGKLVGSRTWGGLIGNPGNPGLIDGGQVRIPARGVFDPDGTWPVEGWGVEPDIAVPEDPGAMAQGRDPQLEAAIEHLREELRRHPPRRPARPAYPDRSGGEE